MTGIVGTAIAAIVEIAEMTVADLRVAGVCLLHVEVVAIILHVKMTAASAITIAVTVIVPEVLMAIAK